MTWVSSGADASGRYGTKTGAVADDGERVEGERVGLVALWLWVGAGFRGGGGVRGVGGEYDVKGWVANGLKLVPLSGETRTGVVEVDMAREREQLYWWVAV